MIGHWILSYESSDFQLEGGGGGAKVEPIAQVYLLLGTRLGKFEIGVEGEFYCSVITYTLWGLQCTVTQ